MKTNLPNNKHDIDPYQMQQLLKRIHRYGLHLALIIHLLDLKTKNLRQRCKEFYKMLIKIISN